MNRTIPQTVLSLLPTLNPADLPPQLVELAGSLLSQSRHLLSSLKAEEEIARTYACAHIACDRLKITLNLPPIVPRPPIPPRVYKRLYAHLDKILPNQSTGTPRSAARSKGGVVKTPNSVRFRDALAESPSSGRRGARGERPTPSKEQSLAQFRSPAAGKPSTITNGGGGGQDSRGALLPPWLRPTARFVCSELGEMRVLPFVMAGIDAIVLPHGKLTEDEWVLQNMPALLAAIIFYSTRAAANTAAAAADGDPAEEASRSVPIGDLSNEQYKVLEKRLLSAMKKASTEVDVAKDGDKEAWKQWTDLKSRGFKQALMITSDRQWLEDDWFHGIGDLDQAKSNAGRDKDEAGDGEVHLHRADTMLQHKYNYLSERRRREYQAWKANILKRIEVLERNPGDAMQVDS